MAFDINVFYSQINATGWLEPNKYDIAVTAPVTVPPDIQYRCIAATLPGQVIRTVDNNRLGVGVMEKMAYAGGYTDVSLSFICDKGGTQYNFWYQWLNYVFESTGDVSGNLAGSVGATLYSTSYKDNAAGQIQITVYENDGNASMNYTLYKAYPVAINDSPVSWSETNDLLKLTVIITFREWSLITG